MIWRQDPHTTARRSPPRPIEIQGETTTRSILEGELQTSSTSSCTLYLGETRKHTSGAIKMLLSWCLTSREKSLGFGGEKNM